MIKNLNDCTVLNNGIKMPWFGLGVFQMTEPGEAVDGVTWALEAGYRSIDTASVYGNEAGVEAALDETGGAGADPGFARPHGRRLRPGGRG